MNWYVDRWRANDKEVKKLLKSTELWFVPVANPDGYQYTFDTERLWRKNLRDNDGDGQITVGDGVDPNRNFPNHWGYDNEGSSADPVERDLPRPGAALGGRDAGDEGPARPGRVRRSRSTTTPTASGCCTPRAGRSARRRPTTRSTTRCRATSTSRRSRASTRASARTSSTSPTARRPTTRTPARARWPGRRSCPRAAPAAGSCSPTTRRWSRRSSSGTCRSPGPSRTRRRTRTTRSRSLGHRRPSRSTWRATTPTSAGSRARETSRSTYSYGDPQPVRVLAKRSLGAVTREVQDQRRRRRSGADAGVDGGETLHARPASTTTQVRGVVTGTKPGDTVEVWFEGGGQKSDVVHLRRRSPRPATGCSSWRPRTTRARRRPRRRGPHYAHYYLDALTANGIDADVYDVDARGRIAPDQLGVLSHYDAVVWYTGDDIVTREGRAGAPATPTGSRWTRCSSCAPTSTRAAGCSTPATGPASSTRRRRRHPALRPEGRDRLQPAPGRASMLARCLALRGSGDGVNDVLQYWFGALSSRSRRRPRPDTGEPFDVIGIDDPFDGSRRGGSTAPTAPTTRATLSRSSRPAASCRPTQFPQFESWPSARWDKPGGPFDAAHRAASTCTRRSPT